MAELLNVDYAIEQILAETTRLSAESAPLDKALNRVLAEDIVSQIHLPPFANSSMDGYAVRAADIEAASRAFPVELAVSMDIPAGSFPTKTLESGSAARIMTGAPIPPGADAVIPVEDTDSEWSAADQSPMPQQVRIFKAVHPGDSIRPIGENVKIGDIVLQSGTIVRPQDIGILAALGFHQIQVIRRPRVAIISTGDELVEPHESLAAGKIYDSNRYMLAALIEARHAEAIRLPIAKDRLDEVRAVFHQALEHQPDMILSSAGVSVGAADLIRTVLDELGDVGFWRINLRPGKPLAYGHVGAVPFFGLPGNPVSAMVTFEVLVRPALAKLAGRPHQPAVQKATIRETLYSDGRRSYIRVRLTHEQDLLIATPTGNQSSGALISMVQADGLLIIPEDVKRVEPGTELTVQLLHKH